MMQQAADFRDESEALFRLIEGLSDAELETQTLFKKWTITEIVNHLHMWNHAAELSLRDGDAFKRFYKEVFGFVAAGKTLREFERNWAGGLKGRALVAAWRDFYLPMAERFGATDPAMRVKWAGPDMSVRSSISARLMETWAHAQAAYDLLAVDRIDTDRIRNIVILGVNTYGWSFTNRGIDVPGPMPFLELTAPSGEVWRYGEDTQPDRISGTAAAFCQVVAQTRNVADVALDVRGANANAWMAHAQCFAGPPETPPPAGLRRKSAKRLQI